MLDLRRIQLRLDRSHLPLQDAERGIPDADRRVVGEGHVAAALSEEQVYQVGRRGPDEAMDPDVALRIEHAEVPGEPGPRPLDRELRHRHLHPPELRGGATREV